MTTWKDEAAAIIAEATRHLPDDAPLIERKRAIAAACPSSWRRMSWPQKAWADARREHLIPYGYEPKTKKHAAQKAAAMSDLPLFAAEPGED